MLEGKGMQGKGNRHAMPMEMQIEAMGFASKALDVFDVLDCSSIAAQIKKEFERVYGSGWQCVVGSSFGCSFTYSKGTYLYLALETLNFLIFKPASTSH